MKSLKEYLSTSNSETVLFESLDTEMSLQQVYETLYDKMFDENHQLNEGR